MSSREQFEAWYLENWGHTEDDHETLFERDPDSDEEYYRLGVRMSHQAWQAATNAMEAKCSAMAADNEKAMEAMRQADEVVKRAHSKFAALADENMALRSAIENGMAAPETPATDAFLAEVRSQVWIEGNEPAEFGRYWVRYETDIGPQYCSAKWMEHNFCAGSDTNIHKIWLADHSRSINSLRGVTHYTKLPDSLEGTAQ